jgi:hypothetical protein
MNIIETPVPISIDNLKIYFKDKDTKFLLNYDDSQIKEEKFLIYISNLDLPANIIFDPSKEDHLKLLSIYLTTKNIVSLESLELAALQVCLDYKFKQEGIYSEFIKENESIIKEWLNLLESLTIYNFYCIKSKKFKEYVESFEVKDGGDIGHNFVNLLKYEQTNLLFENVEQKDIKFYKNIFNDYMFKGNNLYYYWANENNPLFLFTWKIVNDIESQEEKENVALV